MIEAEVIDLLWEKIEPIAFITKDQFARGLEAWDIEVVRDEDDEIAFVTMVQGPEFHFESFGSGIQITRAMIAERLNPIIERHGYVDTRTPCASHRQQRFNRTFGFTEVARDEFFIHYRLSKPCP